MTFTMRDPDLKALVEMHTFCRPAGSKAERQFIRDYILPLGVDNDDKGNRIKRIGRAPVLWSCHTDTVHRVGGRQPIDVQGECLRLAPNAISNCLGADDTAGV